MDTRRRTDVRPDHSVVQQARIDANTDTGAVVAPYAYGQPLTRVDFFRRMPTGGATAYFKPAASEN